MAAAAAAGRAVGNGGSVVQTLEAGLYDSTVLALLGLGPVPPAV